MLDWFVRRQREGWSAGEEREFQAWLVADPRRGEAWRAWESRWRAVDAIPAAAVAGWREGFAGRAAAPTRRGFMKPALALAATGMAVGAGYLGWRELQAQPVFVQAFATRPGQHRERPLEVRVVGTRFAVRHTPGIDGADGTRVSVEEGRVRVARRHRTGDGAWAAPSAASLREAVFLVAGQQLDSDAQGLLGTVAAVPAEGIAPWREHRLSFVDTPLARALAELERYGSTGLVVNDPAVAALRLTGTFDPRDPRTLRRALSSALPVRLKEAGAVTELVAAH
ncbi:hypothetical protein APR47_17305 [Variovorax paradoxus]|nr:hypothetical protein APR47_17305 [Variovorax paradoxus]